MSLEWNDVVLKDVLSEKGYIRGPFGSALKRAEMKSEGIPVYEQQNAIYDNRIFRYYINEEKYQSLKRFTTYTDDLIISCSGTVGKVSIIKHDDPKGIISQALLTLRVNKDLILPEFLKYFFSSYEGYNSLVSRATGSVQVNISKRAVIEEIPLKLPPLDVQRKIVHYLSLIDKKIETNEKINKNLQKQINILFKSFFINFEFYDGKYQETLFGEIPIEWNIILFKDILNERNEKSTNQDISMYSVTLDGIQPRADIYKKKITAKTTKFKIIHKYDLIFGMPNSGYQYGIMYDEIGGVSLAYPVFEINGIQPRYVDLFIKNISNYFNDIVKSGSRMGQGIDKKVLLSKEIYVPPNEHLDKYYSIESKLLDLINHNLTEINNLTKLRDTLLPKLMSGEIDVSKINCDLELKYNYMKYLFNQIHTPMSKSVV